MSPLTKPVIYQLLRPTLLFIYFILCRGIPAPLDYSAIFQIVVSFTTHLPAATSPLPPPRCPPHLPAHIKKSTSSTRRTSSNIKPQAFSNLLRPHLHQSTHDKKATKPPTKVTPKTKKAPTAKLTTKAQASFNFINITLFPLI